MVIEIIEKKNESLFVYKEGKLLFYSTVKFNWISKNIKIYNQNDILLLELAYKSVFFKSTYKILYQNKFLTSLLTEVDGESIFFDTDKTITIKPANFISLSHNFNYFFKENKIAEVKQNIWRISTKYELYLKDENLEFLDQIIIHILSIKTGFSSV
ncbi:hypothetical protein AR687_06285 [Flavobacteriaceae bacterium CRH]|nr:hypothetical protein AR687_06285 [Flavobacteriaceae bacterium CRH]